MEERRKKWMVLDSRGHIAGWFLDEEIANAFADEIGGTVKLVYV